MEKTFFTIELIREYLQKDPQLLYELKCILDYRNLRSEQTYYSRLAHEYDFGHNNNIFRIPKIVREASSLDREHWRDRITALDKNRRATHNRALVAFHNIVQTGIKNGLDYIYAGHTLTGKQATQYEYPERRTEITDAMFELLDVIEKAALAKTEQAPEIVSLNTMQDDMNQFNRAYSIKNSLKKDEDRQKDGGIEFYFQSKKSLNNNENL